MGTKANPAANDCYSRALPDEPHFALLARDPTAPAVVLFWATHREAMIARGDAPESDMSIVGEARACVENMRAWRQENDGAWRRKREPSDSYTDARDLIAGALQHIVPGTAEGIGEGGELTVLEHNAVEALAMLIDAALDGRNGNHDGQPDLIARR